MTRAALLAVAVSLVGCAARRAPVTTPLIADDHALPWVQVVVGDVTTRALVDTGASDHVMSGRFFRRALGREPRGVRFQITGFTGEKSEALVVQGVAVGLGGVTLPLDDLAVSDRMDVDLVLSAPRLAARTPIELDLQDMTLRLGVQLDPSFGATGGTACRPIRGDTDLLWTVLAQVDGAWTPFILDSGAEFVSLSTSDPAGARLAVRSTDGGRVGSALGIWQSRHADAVVTFAEVDASVVVRLVPDEDRVCGAGVLGMSVLRQCRVQLGKRSARVSCRRRAPADARTDDDK